jgi:hypothetical protein
VQTFEDILSPIVEIIGGKAKRYVEQKKKLESTPANAPARKYIELELNALQREMITLDGSIKLILTQVESMCIGHYLEYKAIVDFKNDAIEQMAQAYEFTHDMAIKLLEEKTALKKTQYTNTLNIAA